MSERKTVVEQLYDERTENEALRAKLKAAEAKTAELRVQAAQVRPAAAPLTYASAAEAYNRLTTARERAAFRKANWKILGINEEK